MPRRSNPKSRSKATSRKRVTSKKSKNSKNVDDYTHHGASRISIPTEQLEANVKKDLEKYKPNISVGKEPVLCWNRHYNMDETSPAPLHIREKISPRDMIEGLRSDRGQTQIFDNFNGFTPGTKYRYYDHSSKGNWQNRMIRGDSARVMAALVSEDLEGEVQTIFFDPPYGINFDSNFTPSMKRPGNSNADSLKPGMKLPKDPISVQVFCDTWDRGLDSYLDAMYQRLVLMRSLLKDSGSIFVQIGSTNVHRMAILLDEVFGSCNRISTITIAKSTGTTSSFIPEGSDYLLWYVKDKSQAMSKYSQLYDLLDRNGKIDLMSSYAMFEDINGYGSITDKNRQQILDSKDVKIFRRSGLLSQGDSRTGRSNDYQWNGQVYKCPPGSQWRISIDGLDHLDELDRLVSVGKNLQWKQYEHEIPGRKINNRWSAPTHSSQNKRFPVQTPENIIERCILMTSDTGDLVLDPTGGSGSTASVAEKHGRRWIVIDTSPVSIATMRHYMSTKIFDWYLLQDSKEGSKREKDLGGIPRTPPYNNDPSLGFVYERVPYVSASILGYDKLSPSILLVNSPIASTGNMRVSGPFTVESETSSYILSSLSDHTDEHNHEFTTRVLDCMLIGIESLDSTQKMIVRDLKPLPKFDGFTHTGVRDDTNEQIAILITPDVAPADNRLIREAAASTKKHNLKSLVVAAFEFQPLSIQNFIDDVEIIKVSINRALQQPELDILKIKRALVVVGDPRLLVTKINGKWIVEISGYDMYDPISGNIISGDKSNVDCWMIDTEYNGESFFARELHFPNANSAWTNSQMKQITKMLGNDIDDERWRTFTSLKSSPFVSKNGKIAVKIITMTGDEMMVRGSLESLMKHSQPL